MSGAKSSKTARFARWSLLAMVTASILAPRASEAQSQPPADKVVLQTIPGVVRFDVGDLHMTALSDGTVSQDLHKITTNAPPGDLERSLNRAYATNPVEVSINVVLIEVGRRLVLVDTGSGELFGPGNGGKLLSSLAASGLRPEQITDILITHVHADHSGGLTVNGKLLFPNATVYASKPDVDFFLNPANAAKTGYDIHYFNQAIQTFKPYLDTGKVRTFTGTTEVIPGITAVLHPGHTPGSTFYVAESRGESITFIGDLIHFGAVQFPNPSITVIYDVDPKAAAATRMQQFGVFARERTLLAAPHLPFPGVGHIRAEPSGGYTWVPIDYSNRKAK